MRIEKISENQIRCTLNEKDLSDRELHLSELAYGTDKAKALFRDMMQQAAYEFGFEADDIPLMIEAIPMYPSTLVIIITKVDDPDELDTRFSTFSDDSDDGEYDIDDEEYDLISTIDDIDDIDDIDFPSSSTEDNTDFISLPEALGMEPRQKTVETSHSTDLIKIYSFDTLNQVSALAENINGAYDGVNTLYKDNAQNKFYLVMHKSSHTPEDFNRVCNMVNEYGTQFKGTTSNVSYFDEHYEVLISSNALQILSSL